MDTLVNELKQEVVDTLKKFGDEKAVILKGRRSWTGFEAAKEVEEETEFGKDFLKNLLRLSLDLVKRQKESIERKTQ